MSVVDVVAVVIAVVAGALAVGAALMARRERVLSERARDRAIEAQGVESPMSVSGRQGRSK